MRRKIVILPVLGLLLLFSLISFLGSRRPETVGKGYTDPVFPESWQYAIVQSASREAPKVRVDGREVPATDALPYMIQGPDMMLPLRMIREGIPACISDTGEKVFLYRGVHRLILDPGTDEVITDSGTALIAGAAVRTGGTVYVAASVLSDALGYEMEILPEEPAVLLSKKDPGEPELPPAFSYQEVGKMPEVLDQGNLGTCYAFSTLSALEATMLPEKSFRFSRDHMILSDNFSSGSLGGETGRALSYLLSWQGPVSAEGDPYGDGVTDYEKLPLCHVQGTCEMENPSPEELKKAVFLKGGVSATLYLAMADEAHPERTAECYSFDHAAYCCTDKEEVNHAVVIVGWDDAYPKENFPHPEKIPGDGAFLCLNSWGENFGRSGLFYVSYYDRSFAGNAVWFTDIGDRRNFDGLLQSDLSGMTGTAGYGDETVWAANVFTAPKDLSLSAAGFYTLGPDSSYELYYVPDFTGTEDFSRRQFLCSGSFTLPGFHTVSVPDAPEVREGTRFSLLLRIRTPDALYPAAIEKVTEAAPYADISDGEGYLSANGVLFKSAEHYGSCNVCLKAYYRLR